MCYIDRADLNIVTMRHIGSKYADVSPQGNIFKVLLSELVFLPLIQTRKRKVSDDDKCYDSRI